MWDEAADPFTGAVKVTISRLRAKLGEPAVIETVAKAGYRIWARARLTLIYGGLFLLSGAALMAIAYALLVNAGFVFSIPGGPPANSSAANPASPITALPTHPSRQTLALARSGAVHAQPQHPQLPEPNHVDAVGAIAVRRDR